MAKKQPNFFMRKYIAMQECWNDGIHGSWQRFLAHVDAHLGDHAYFRLFFSNLHRLSDTAWRSNQPSPRQIKRHARRGIRTIVNLRGPSRWGSYALEKEACARYGVRLIDHRMYSRRMPSYKDLLETQAMFESLQGPDNNAGDVLFHCKSGADRAGICSALYVLMVRKGNIDEALQQLSLRYLHFKYSNTGRLDYFLEAYRDFNREREAKGEAPLAFMDWARDHYNPKQLTKAFHAGVWISWLVDKVLRRE